MNAHEDLHGAPATGANGYWDHREAAWVVQVDPARRRHDGARSDRCDAPTGSDPWRLVTVTAPDGVAVPVRAWLPPLPGVPRPPMSQDLPATVPAPRSARPEQPSVRP